MLQHRMLLTPTSRIDVYAQVFNDYVAVMKDSSPLLTLLPTPVFWYGLVVGQEFPLTLPNPTAACLLKPEGGKAAVVPENGSPTDVKIKLERVGPAKKGGMRTVSLMVAGALQNVEVKDSTSGEDFAGPMAAPDNPLQVRLCLCSVVLCVNKGTIRHGLLICTGLRSLLEPKPVRNVLLLL